MDKKKTKKWIIIAFLVIILMGVITYAATGKYRYYRALCKEVLATCLLVGEEYGVTDFTFDRYTPAVHDNAHGFLVESPTFYINSTQFSNLSAEQMKQFFNDAFLKSSWVDSDFLSKTGGAVIQSCGNEYRYARERFDCKLWANDKIIYSENNTLPSSPKDNDAWDAIQAMDDAFWEAQSHSDTSQCTICGKSAKKTFQGSGYCTTHYNDAVKWAIDNAADKDE